MLLLLLLSNDLMLLLDISRCVIIRASVNFGVASSSVKTLKIDIRMRIITHLVVRGRMAGIIAHRGYFYQCSWLIADLLQIFLKNLLAVQYSLALIINNSTSRRSICATLCNI